MTLCSPHLIPFSFMAMSTLSFESPTVAKKLLVEPPEVTSPIVLVAEPEHSDPSPQLFSTILYCLTITSCVLSWLLLP